MTILFFGMLRFSIIQLPIIITNAIKSLISGQRIINYLNEDDQKILHICRDEFLRDDENIGKFYFFSTIFFYSNVKRQLIYMG